MLKKNIKKFLEGRKKLKLFDYLIIFFVLLVLAILLKILIPEEKWVNTLIYDDNLSIYQLNTLHLGDIEKDPSGKTIAIITDIRSYNVSSKGTLPYKNVYLQAKLLAKVNPRNNELEYKGKVIKSGNSIEIKFNYNYIKGIIRELENLKDIPTETKILTVKVYDQWPWFAESLNIGEGETDEKGEKLIELISKEVMPAEMTVITANGDTLLRTNPRKVDITLKIKTKTQKLPDGNILKKEIKLVIGEGISIDIGKSHIGFAQIMDIE